MVICDWYDITDLSSIDGSLIHTLYNGRTSAQNDKEVQLEWLAPAVIVFVSQPAFLFLRQHIDLFVTIRAILYSSHQRTLVEDLSLVGKTACLDETVNVLDDFPIGHSTKRVAKFSGNSSNARASLRLMLIMGNIIARIASGGRRTLLLVDGLVVDLGSGHDCCGSGRSN